jgi:hypothetical protein
MVRIILVPFVFYRDHDDWPLHLSARTGLLDLHRAPPLQKLLAAGLPGSLLLVKLLLDLHRAPPLQKLLAAGLPGSLLLVKLLLDLHRAPPLQKLLAAGLPGSLLVCCGCCRTR